MLSQLCLGVVLCTRSRFVRKNDLGFLTVMVSGPKSFTKRSPHHSLKGLGWALIMGHSAFTIEIDKILERNIKFSKIELN